MKYNENYRVELIPVRISRHCGGFNWDNRVGSEATIGDVAELKSIRKFPNTICGRDIKYWTAQLTWSLAVKYLVRADRVDLA